MTAQPASDDDTDLRGTPVTPDFGDAGRRMMASLERGERPEPDAVGAMVQLVRHVVALVGGMAIYVVYILVMCKVAVGAFWVSMFLCALLFGLKNLRDTGLDFLPFVLAALIVFGIHCLVRRWWRRKTGVAEVAAKRRNADE